MAGSSESKLTESEKSKDERSISEDVEQSKEGMDVLFEEVSILSNGQIQILIDEDITTLEDLSHIDDDRIMDLTGMKEEEVKALKDEIDSMISEDGADAETSLDIEETDDIDIDNFEALKAWLEGDEGSFLQWIGDESEIESRMLEKTTELSEKETEIEEKEKDLVSRMEEVEKLRSKYLKKLEEIDTGEFDPDEVQELIEENTILKERVDNLQHELESLSKERNSLKDEISDVKQSSMAMLKYIEDKKFEEVVEPDEEIVRLREENEELGKKIEELKSREPKTEIDYGEIGDEELAEKLESFRNDLESKQTEIEQKDKKIQDLQSELTLKKEELKRIREKLGYKEEELSHREEDLKHREEVLKKQTMELESRKKEIGDTTEKERKRRLKELEKEISRKEQEINAKEKYIKQKERELRAKEEDLIEEELEERQEEILKEIEQEKARTGTSRLDDLMLGGIPLGSNVSIYGPPHCGKKVLINSFIAEGLEKGVPAIWVITDKTVDDVRDEMKFVLPTYQEYERRGLVHYVDAYSVSMGEVEEDEEDKEYVNYIKEQSDVKGIRKAVENITQNLKEENRYYRLAFISISTLIAYLDTATTFKTLQPFAGRRKRDKSVSLYTLEKGMHSEQDISMFGHMMDGEIEFKFDQLKTYLRVEGLGDVQTRDWIEYSASKTGISMGSFSLDTIR
ncbi:MAG: DUF7504 family protein [Thermoplasmatota archaeon]